MSGRDRSGGTTRKRSADGGLSKRAADGQLGLFETQDASLVGRHWSGYPRGARPSADALVLWAETFSHLPKGARAVLVALARQAETTSRGRRAAPSSCRIALRAFARLTGMGRNTCKRHLETLMAAGPLMVKVWEPVGGSFLGYDFRLIVDVDDHAAAIADGFTASRLGRGQE